MGELVRTATGDRVVIGQFSGWLNVPCVVINLSPPPASAPPLPPPPPLPRAPRTLCSTARHIVSAPARIVDTAARSCDLRRGALSSSPRGVIADSSVLVPPPDTIAIVYVVFDAIYLYALAQAHRRTGRRVPRVAAQASPAADGALRATHQSGEQTHGMTLVCNILLIVVGHSFAAGASALCRPPPGRCLPHVRACVTCPR